MASAIRAVCRIFPVSHARFFASVVSGIRKNDTS